MTLFTRTQQEFCAAAAWPCSACFRRRADRACLRPDIEPTSDALPATRRVRGIASYVALVFPRVAQHPDLTLMFRGHGKDSQQRQFHWSSSRSARRLEVHVPISVDRRRSTTAWDQRSELGDVHEDRFGRHEREEVSERHSRRIPGDLALFHEAWCKSHGHNVRPSYGQLPDAARLDALRSCRPTLTCEGIVRAPLAAIMVGMAHAHSHGQEPAALGVLLQYWRRARNLSQLALAHEANVSPRHVCFLETGRAKPSRDMVLLLADTLAVPLRERNALLLAAGFAPMFRMSTLDDRELAPVRAAIDAILKQQEPYPAVVMNRHWDILANNAAATRFFGMLLDGRTPQGAGNILRLMFHPEGLRPFVENWEAVAQALVRRVHREAVGGALDEDRTSATGRSAQLPRRPAPMAHA